MQNEKNRRTQVITPALKIFREEAHLRKETEKVQTKVLGPAPPSPLPATALVGGTTRGKMSLVFSSHPSLPPKPLGRHRSNRNAATQGATENYLP